MWTSCRPDGSLALPVATDAVFISDVIAHLAVSWARRPAPAPDAAAVWRGTALFNPQPLPLRNVAYLLRGQPLFDHFDVPAARSYAPRSPYTAEHLAWQFEKARFDSTVDLEDFAHVPNAPFDRVLSALGARCAVSPAIAKPPARGRDGTVGIVATA